MQVNKTQGEIARTQAAQRAQGGVPIPVASDPVAPVGRVDAVQISDAGRALSGSDAGAADSTSDAAGLDPRRADEIRTRILSGAYNSVEMADKVAQSILRSGDL